MEQRTKKGTIKYIVDHSLRGTSKVEPVILRHAHDTHGALDIFNREAYASMMILRAYKRWRMRTNLNVAWRLVRKVSVPRQYSSYELEIFETVNSGLRASNCKFKLVNTKSGERF
jgi:hypothetical protein